MTIPFQNTTTLMDPSFPRMNVFCNHTEKTNRFFMLLKDANLLDPRVHINKVSRLWIRATKQMTAQIPIPKKPLAVAVSNDWKPGLWHSHEYFPPPVIELVNRLLRMEPAAKVLQDFFSWQCYRSLEHENFVAYFKERNGKKEGLYIAEIKETSTFICSFFKNDSLQPQMVTIDCGDKVIEGTFQNGWKGRQIVHFKDGTFKIHEIVNGLFQGHACIKNSDGTKEFFSYKDSKKHGSARLIYPLEGLETYYSYSNDLREGEERTIHNDFPQAVVLRQFQGGILKKDSAQFCWFFDHNKTLSFREFVAEMLRPLLSQLPPKQAAASNSQKRKIEIDDDETIVVD